MPHVTCVTLLVSCDLCHDFACLQADQGGSIDPSVFTDSDGKRWLLFKNDGNAVDKPTHIYLRPLSPDALQVPLYDKDVGITDMSLVPLGHIGKIDLETHFECFT